MFSWTDGVRNEVLQRVKEERNILQTIKRGKAKWIDHILCSNCLLKHVLEGKLEGRMEVMGRQGRRRKKLLDDLKGGQKEYWKLREETLHRTQWRTCHRTDYRMNDTHFITNAITAIAIKISYFTSKLLE
jgi:hypothetical protein